MHFLPLLALLALCSASLHRTAYGNTQAADLLTPEWGDSGRTCSELADLDSDTTTRWLVAEGENSFIEGAWSLDQPWGNTDIVGANMDTSLALDGSVTVTISSGSELTIACLRVTNVRLPLPPSNNSFLWPTVFAPASSSSSLTLVDVVLETDCDTLLAYQAFLCTTRPPGDVHVHDQKVYLDNWSWPRTKAVRTMLTCSSFLPSSPHASAPLAPACVMLPVGDASELAYALKEYQSSTPLVMVLRNNCSFGSPIWPDGGLEVKSNVTLMATSMRRVVLDFELQADVFYVSKGSSGNMTFQGCVLLNLPIIYLPLDHPRRHVGILSTSVWPVNRQGVSLTLLSCTLVLSPEEFAFWQYWLTIMDSPVPSIRALANWTQADLTTVDVEPAGADYYINIANYRGKYTTLVNVRYEVSGYNYTTMQQKSITQVTGDLKVPPTNVYQAGNAEDLVQALARLQDSTAEHYIVLTNNITLANISSAETEDLPLEITGPTTVTGWPQTYAVVDFQRLSSWFLLSATVTLKNMILLNLGRPIGEVNEPGARLSSALWLFHTSSSWGDKNQQKSLLLDRVALVVPQSEVMMYLQMATNSSFRANTGPLSDWVLSSTVYAYDKVNMTWVYFTYLMTARYTATKVNITSIPPSIYNIMPYDTANGDGEEPAPIKPPKEGGRTKREVLLFSLVAITLPTAFAAAVITCIVLKRRRLRAMCQAAHMAGGKEDVEEAKQDPNLCVMFSKVVCGGDTEAHEVMASKGQNPLYTTPAVSVPPRPSSQYADTIELENLGASSHPLVSSGGSTTTAQDSSLLHDTRASSMLTVLDPERELQRLREIRRDIGDRQLEVQHSLGWGGCGVVYRGTWKGLPVAVKVVLLQGDRQAQRPHLMEAAISSSLIHANIVTTYLYELTPLDEVDNGSLEIKVDVPNTTCWKLYIVQEFCDHGTLKSAVDQGWFCGVGQPPDMRMVLAMALDVSAGLVHIHSKNIIHGDLSSSNVLLQSCADRQSPVQYIAKLADFGLSVKMEHGQTHHSRVFQGTPHYMAPEVLQHGFLSKAADVYAMGVLLWELYCGTPPWRRPHNPLQMDLSGDAVAAGGSSKADTLSFPPMSPAEYVKLAKACLCVDPAARPTAEQVRSALLAMMDRH